MELARLAITTTAPTTAARAAPDAFAFGTLASWAFTRWPLGDRRGTSLDGSVRIGAGNVLRGNLRLD